MRYLFVVKIEINLEFSINFQFIIKIKERHQIFLFIIPTHFILLFFMTLNELLLKLKFNVLNIKMSH